MIKKLILAFPTLGLLMAVLVATPSSASVIQLNFSLAHPVQFAAPGGPALSFVGTLTAPLSNTGDVYLNADTSNADGPLVLDDGPFFSTPPSLSPGQSFTGVIFTVTLPATAVSGTTYNGYFEIDGGADGGAGDFLASATFAVTATPEPGTAILLLLGFLALALAFRRKRGHAIG
jgi:hypothetical protein